MGVAGLWEVLRPAAKTRSLTELAITEGFEANPDGKRGYRLGIDASIWFFHAEYGREGENPVLRTLFFRCANLMRTTFLPLFVFDGPKRPDFKRGKKINKMGNKLIPGMKQIIEAFGFEWRMAPGEAEAELAYLNRIGIIDGILSDDVDNFLFGATTVIRNPSNNLSGNRSNPVLNSAGKDDKNHTRVYKLDDIARNEEISLTRGGLILIGLMSGGDYQQGGVMGCGPATAHGLAKCGFGDSLYEAARALDREDLGEFLVSWRQELQQELRTNSKKKLGRKQAILANSIPQNFPDIDILLSYVNPVTSESMGREDNNAKITWSKEPDLCKLAATCEFYFEWGYKEAIIRRFRTVMWHSIVLRILRRAVLDLDMKSSTSKLIAPSTPRKKGKQSRQTGTPSKLITTHFSSLTLSTPEVYFSSSESDDEEEKEPLIIKIYSLRTHASTDGLPEYRLEISPKQLVELTEAGIKGIRLPEGPDEWASEPDDDEGDEIKKKGKGKLVRPDAHLRLWMPVTIVKIAKPNLVQEFEDIQKKKDQRKADKGTLSKEPKKMKSRSMKPVVGQNPDAFSSLPSKKAPTRRTNNKFKVPPFVSDEDDGNMFGYDATFNCITEVKEKMTTIIDDPLKRKVLPRTGVKDLTKKQTTANRLVQNNLKDIFPVTKTAAPVFIKGYRQPSVSKVPNTPTIVQHTFTQDITTSIPDKFSGRANPRKLDPSLSHPNTLRPIDISDDSSNEEYPSTLWKKAVATSSASKRTANARHSELSSDSDVVDRINKSPRKKAEQSFPLVVQRPISPSPEKPKQSSALFSPTGNDVIELTDSESDNVMISVPTKYPPPLMIVQNRAKAIKLKEKKIAKPEKIKQPSEVETIDIT